MRGKMSVYQVRRVCSIAVDRPVATAAACAGCVCVCAGRTLTVRDEHDQPAVVALGHEVDAVTCWREEGGCLVAVADRSGYVHVLSPWQLTPLHSHHVMEMPALPCGQPVFSALEKVSDETHPLCLMALTSCGSIYVMYLQTHTNTNAETIITIMQEMVCVRLDVTGTPHFVKISHCPYLLTGGSGLLLWELSFSPPRLSPCVSLATILSDMSVVQAQTTPNGEYLVTRSEQCEVQLWLLAVMVMVGVWGGRNGQPQVVQASLSSYRGGGGGEFQLCCLCCREQEGQGQLVVLSVPEMEPVFSTEVAVNSLLTVAHSGLGSVQGAVCVLQPSQCEDGTTNLEVSMLDCGSPEDRLAVLVNEGRFEEADELVQSHCLDPELLLQEKAAMLNRRLCAGEEQQLPSFLQCLHQMKDVGATAVLVLESSYPSLSLTHSVLSATCAQVSSNSILGQTMISALDRLTTFSLIAAQDNFSEAWHAFQRGTCLQIVHYLLQNDRLLHAKLFWTRHQVTVQEELLAGLDMPGLALLMPSDLSSILSWVPATILPFLLAHSPQHMREYLSELRNILCSLELTDKDHWPGNALALAEGLLASISELSPSPGWSVDASPLTELQTQLVKLASVLDMIQSPLSFETYEQSTSEQLVYRALDQAVDPAHVHQLIADKLTRFSQEHQLNLDSVLASYLKLFLERAPTHSPDFSDSPLETKIIALTRAIACSELCVGSCLELLHCISPPWSQGVASLVQDCLQLDTASGPELHSLYDLLQLKSMLHGRYGIVDFNFSDSNTGQLYIRYILAQKKASALADSLRVAAKYGIPEHKVYMHHFYNLCSRNQVEETRDVMNTLPPEVLASTAQATLSFCLHRLKFPYISGQCESVSHRAAAQLAVLCADVLQSPADWSGDCCLEKLQCVRDLAVEFAVYLSPQQLSSPLNTSQLLQRTLATLAPPTVRHCVPARAVRFGKLLGYSEEEVYCHLIRLWIEQITDSDALVALIETSPTHLNLHTLRSVLCDWPSHTPSLARCLCSCALSATTVCTPDNLETALSIFRVCSVLSELLRCCAGGRGEAVWPWAARVSEQGIVLQLAQLRPAILQVASALLMPGSEQSTPASIPPCSEVLDLLQSNGHHSLAHHITVQYQLVQGTAAPVASLLSPLVEKVLSMPTVDHSYGLALLLATPPDTALQLLCSRQTSNISSYSRVIALCTLTVDYCQLVTRPQVRRTAVALMTGALWGKQLRKYQVSFSSAFRGGNEEKRQVLSKLLHLQHIPPQVVLAYCRTFGLEVSGAMLTRIRVALTEWDNSYQDAYEAAMTTIRKHPFIPSLLDTFLTSKVCPYDYERIQFVLDQILPRSESNHHQQMQLLLSLLVTYDRCHPPSEEEEEWHSTHCRSVCKAAQDLSSQRLPLHMLLQPQLGLHLLAREVADTSTLARLAAIARLIDIPEDEFYSTAVSVLDTRTLSFPQLTPVLACVSHAPTQLSLIMKLTNHLSDADKVTALETALCLLKAPDSSGSQSEEEAIALQLREARARLLLGDAGLGCYWQPNGIASIISALYSELPLQQSRPAPALVHEVVKSIADLHGDSALTITSHLLEEWLQPASSSQQDLNTTLVREMMEVEVDDTEERSTETWARMVYLLTDNPEIEPLAALLYRWAKAELPILSPTPRLRALRLLLTTVPISVVETVSGGSLADLREAVQHAVFAGELASVQMTAMTAEAFQACNKITLAGNLLHTHRDSPKALRIVVDLCLQYRLVDAALWAGLLDALLTLKMTGYLQRVLPGLVGLGVHYTVSNVSSVWQAAVQVPYEAGRGKDSLAPLHLLYQCPILCKVDILSIIRTMTGVGAHSHALCASLLLAPSLRASTVKGVLDDVPASGLLQVLEEVTGSTSPQLAQVSDVVYDYVDCSGRYECLLGSAHFPPLVHYLILHQRLSPLIHASLSRGRVTEAAQLVEMYHDQHHSSAPSGVDGLKVYLEMEGDYSQWEHQFTD